MLWSVACSYCAHCARASANEPVYYRGGNICVMSMRVYYVEFASLLNCQTQRQPRHAPFDAQTSRPLFLDVFKSFFPFFLAFLFFIILRCFALGSICRHLVLLSWPPYKFPILQPHSAWFMCVCRSIAILGISFALFSIIFIWILFWFSRLPHKHLGNLCETYYKIIVEGYLSLQKYI